MLQIAKDYTDPARDYNEPALLSNPGIQFAVVLVCSYFLYLFFDLMRNKITIRKQPTKVFEFEVLEYLERAVKGKISSGGKGKGLNLAIQDISSTEDRLWNDVQSIRMADRPIFTMDADSVLKKLSITGRVIVVADATAWNFHGERFVQWVTSAGRAVEAHTMEGQERNKTLENALKIIDFFDQKSVLRRSEPVLVFGGGVVNDTAGFACATWRRGIPWVRIPTTLLAMVDASVGIKTSVNYRLKNGFGAFHSPKATLIDASLMHTQTVEDLRPALGEIIKAGIIWDREILLLMRELPPLETNELFKNSPVLHPIMRRSVDAMVECIGPDLRELQLVRPMDFGHSFSRWYETEECFAVPHGVAVALDSFLNTRYALEIGFVKQGFMDTVCSVYAHHGVPACHPDLTMEVIRTAIKKITIHRDGQLRAPLPVTDRVPPTTVVYVQKLDMEAMQRALSFCHEFATEHPQCMYALS